MKKLVITIALILVTSTAYSADRWTGVYTTAGQDVDGTPYTGFVEIAPIPDTTLYNLRWDSGVFGVGYEHDGVLIVIGANQPFFASYKKDGKGLWLTPGLTSPRPERLTKTKAKTLEEIAPVRPGPTPAGIPHDHGLISL